MAYETTGVMVRTARPLRMSRLRSSGGFLFPIQCFHSVCYRVARGSIGNDPLRPVAELMSGHVERFLWGAFFISGSISCLETMGSLGSRHSFCRIWHSVTCKTADGGFRQKNYGGSRVSGRPTGSKLRRDAKSKGKRTIFGWPQVALGVYSSPAHTFQKGQPV